MKINILETPDEFYQTLIQNIRTAKREIVLSALYFGTGKLESELLKEVQNALQANPELNVKFIFDHSRSQRGKISSLTLLNPIVTRFYPRFQVNLYQLPQLKEFPYNFFPDQLKEIIGVYHCKFSVFDDVAILTGANLSKEYFTTRQDRYWLIDEAHGDIDSFKLVSFLKKFTNAVSSASIVMLPEAKFRPAVDNAQLQSIYDESLSYSTNGNSSLKILPLIQNSSLGMKAEENFMVQFIKSLASNNNSQNNVLLKWATPYTNFPSGLLEGMIKVCQMDNGSVEVLGPDSDSHGFAGAKGAKSYIPKLHEEALKLSLNDAQNKIQKTDGVFKDDFTNDIIMKMYSRPGWTFHAKGFWFEKDSNAKNGESGTYIGSTNFGERSWCRDFELGFFFISNDNLYKKLFSDDFKILDRFSINAKEILLLKEPIPIKAEPINKVSNVAINMKHTLKLSPLTLHKQSFNYSWLTAVAYLVKNFL